MNKEKTKKKPLITNEEMCDVISQAITSMINMSQNNNFKQQCSDILQVRSDTPLVKDKLNEHFSRFTRQKYTPTECLFDSNETEEKDLSIEALIQNMENIHINAVEELDGFDNWEDCPTKNE